MILFLAHFLLVTVSLRAQFPTASPRAVGFDPARVEVLHVTTKRFVEKGKHAGIITLLARNGKIVDFQTYGYRDLEKQLPMERDTICRAYSMSKIITCVVPESGGVERIPVFSVKLDKLLRQDTVKATSPEARV